MTRGKLEAELTSRCTAMNLPKAANRTELAGTGRRDSPKTRETIGFGIESCPIFGSTPGHAQIPANNRKLENPVSSATVSTVLFVRQAIRWGS